MKENLYLTENRLRRNEMWFAVGNHDYMSHICAKKCFFFDSNLSYTVIDKISNFQEIAPNFTYSQNRNFLKYKQNFLDQLLLPSTFCGRDRQGKYFFIFASCEPLSVLRSREITRLGSILLYKSPAFLNNN